MNKFASRLFAAAIFGGLWMGLPAFLSEVPAAPAASSQQPAAVGSSLLQVADPEPTAANVEAPAPEGSKPGENSIPAGDTEVLATQGATFTAKDRIAVFSGDVRVKDPRFTLACDKLTVYLAKGTVPDAGASPAAAAATTPPPIGSPAKSGDTKPEDANRGGGIDHAVAEGHVIIIQKRAPTKAGEEEKLSVGRADTAEFDNKTGDMTLRGMPRVEQNGNSHEALSRSTWMVLHRDNSLDTHGPSRTLIVPHGKDNLPGSSPAGNGNRANGSPSTGRRASAAGT